jgi:small subunit ribosomal protein S36
VPDPTPTRPGRLGRVPRVVLAATVAFALLGAVWSVVAPLGEAPDEPAHLALVLHLADGNPYPAFDELENQVAIIRLCRTYAAATRACPNEGEEVTATSTRRHPRADAPDKGERPAWDHEGGDARLGQLNQMPQHPPLYYQAMATVLRVERAVLGGPSSTDRELALLRLANVALIAPLPLLAWWAAKRFGLDDDTGAVAAVAVLAVPMLSHIGSTLNNDNLLTLLASVLIALLAGVVRGDRSLRTGALVGLVTALALLTKAFAAVFPPLIVVAYLIGARRALLRPLAVAGGVTVLGAGWWYLGVRSRTGSFAPSIEGRRLTSALQPPGFQPDLGRFVGEFASKLDQRFWGSFGWYTVRVSWGWALLATVVVLAAVATALAPRRGAGDSTRLQRTFLLLPIGALGAFVLLRARSLYVTTGQFPFIQGRYLFAGLVGVFVLVAAGARRWSARWALPGTLAVAGVLQGHALRRCLADWWGGPGLGPRGQVQAMVAWSAWPGELLGLLAVVALAAAGWLVAEVVRGRPVGSDSP